MAFMSIFNGFSIKRSFSLDIVLYLQQTDKINKSRMNTWDGFSVMDFLRDSLNISEFFSLTINDSTLRPFKYIFCPNQTNERC